MLRFLGGATARNPFWFELRKSVPTLRPVGHLLYVRAYPTHLYHITTVEYSANAVSDSRVSCHCSTRVEERVSQWSEGPPMFTCNSAIPVT